MNDNKIDIIASDLSLQLCNLKHELKKINPINNKDYIQSVYNIMQKYSSDNFTLMTQILNFYIEDMINNIQTDNVKLVSYIKACNLMSLFLNKNGLETLAYIIDYADLSLEEIKKKYHQPSINAVTTKISRIMYKLEQKGIFNLLNVYNDEYCNDEKYKYRKIAERIRTIVKYETLFLFSEERQFIEGLKILDKSLDSEISKNLKNLIIKSKKKKYKTVTKKPKK